jgi:hypothetical protein
MRMFVISAFAVTTFVATMAVDSSDANAVTYCRTVGVPHGCVAAPVAPAARAAVETPGVGAPGVGVRARSYANRGGPVNRVGRR